MKTIYMLSAITAEGFGGERVYKQVVAAENEEELFSCKREFAMKYGVMLDMIKASILSKEGNYNERTFVC